MSESAWETDYDTGRDVKPTTPRQTSSTGAAFYTHPGARYVGRSAGGGSVGVSKVVLRVAQILFSLVALTVIASDRQYLHLYDSASGSLISGTLMFNSFLAYRFLLAANVLVFFYAIVQLIHTIATLAARKPFPSAAVGCAYTTFVFDQVFAYILVSVSSAGADASHIIRTGEAGATCSDFGLSRFCTRAEAAVAMSFVGAVFAAVAAATSAHRLFTLLRR